MIHRIIKLPEKQSFFLFGPRQTGKSTLIAQQYQVHIWSVNLLKTDVFYHYARHPEQFRLDAISKIEKQDIKIIFIDEVQRLPDLLNEVQLLMMSYPNIQFILTGSSARKLKRGSANLLAGRAITRTLFPFSYLEIKNQPLHDLLQFGLLPPVMLANSQELKQDILSSYVNSYLKEEIQQEGLVRNIGGFAQFLDVAAYQDGEVLNYSNIARECHLPKRTVQSYYEILEDTLIGFRLLPWRKSIRKRLTAHPKFYLFDTGITNALTQCLSHPLDPYLYGRRFEQWIILEIQKMVVYQRHSVDLYYWRTNHGAEVDLILVKNNQPCIAIEIKSRSTIDSAHFSGLRAFSQDHPEVPLHMVCTCPNAFELSGVHTWPYQEFLTQFNDLCQKL